jgi:hypothetical protein
MSNENHDDLMLFNELDNIVNQVINELVAKYGHKMMIKHYIYFVCSLEFKIKALMYKDTLPKLWYLSEQQKRSAGDFYV